MNGPTKPKESGRSSGKAVSSDMAVLPQDDVGHDEWHTMSTTHPFVRCVHVEEGKTTVNIKKFPDGVDRSTLRIFFA